MSLGVRVQFHQIPDRLLRTELAQRLIFEEEVDAQVRLFNESWIEDAELANAGQDEVLERLGSGDTRR